MRAFPRICRLLPASTAASALAISMSLLVAPAALHAQRPDERFVVEYYYKVRWGYQDEFLALFRKNHLPLLEKQREKGRMVEVTAVTPRYHSTEEGRWDYRVTIVFASVAAAFGPDPITPAEHLRMYPDSAAFAREEKRRFEILEAHWDVPVTPLPLRP